MFRNASLQRLIARVVLTSFISGLMSPIALAQGGRGRALTAGGSNGNSSSTGNNDVLLPVGPRSIAAIKGQTNSVMPAASGIAPPPATATATTATTTTAPRATASTAPADYARALATLIDTSASNSTSQGQLSSAASLTLINNIRSQYQSLVQQQAQVLNAFAATEALLSQNKLPAAILARHQAMVKDFNSRAKQLQDAASPLDNAAAGKSDAATALKTWQQALQPYASVKSTGTNITTNGTTNASKLPWGKAPEQSAKTASIGSSIARQSLAPPPANKPLATSASFAPAPANATPITGSLSGISLPVSAASDIPSPADLAITDDVLQSPDISALAASLHNNPVAIYQYVRNNTSYRVGYGSLQGAAQTLQAQSGNDIDTASLLIALNRTAGIPSRYVYGTVEISIERLQNWLHVDNATAAQSLLNQAGVPNKAILQSGQIVALQIEHTWVEAYVDASPSRGANNQQASAWLPLDPSFKQSTKQSPLNLRDSVALNEAGVFDTARQGATCTADYGQSLKQANLQASFTTYQSQLKQVLAQQGSDLNVGTVLGSSVITPENFALLIGSLPYKTIVKSSSFASLPGKLKGALRLQVFADSAAQAQGQPTVSYSASYAALAGRRLTLSFSPATQADADTLATFLPKPHADNSPIAAADFPASIPGYLIQVTAELRLDGQLVSSGGSFILGSELSASIGNYDAATASWNDSNVTAHAGDYHAIVADTLGISPAQLTNAQQRLAATQSKLTGSTSSNGISRDDLTGEMLHQTILAYFATADANSAIFQRAAGVIEQRQPSHGRAVAQAVPDMAFGLVSSVSFPGVILDIDRLKSATVSLSAYQANQTNQATQAGLTAVAYTRQSNQRNAAYAHLVLEKLYSQSANPVAAASAVRVLAKAASLAPAQQQPVYAVTSANLSAVLLKLPTLSAGQSIDLQNAVAAGYRVLIPQSPLSMSGWTGSAIQIEDLQSGAGAYRLLGNNGSSTASLLAPQGMGWLALATPVQAAASITPELTAAQNYDSVLAGILPGGSSNGSNNGSSNSDNIRWSYFNGQNEVTNGLFLARLATAQGNTPCDSLSALIAANLGTTTGFDGSPADVASVPVITSAPVTAAVAAQAYRYAVAAQDPKGAALSYSMTDAPSGMSISTSGLITWANPVTGSVNVTVRVDNGKAYAEQRYLLTVSDHALPLSISMAVAPAVVNAGDKVTITVLTNGGAGNVSASVTVDGTAVSLDASGTAIITAGAMGAHQVVVTAKDDLGIITKTSLYSVANPADSSIPVAQITTPIDDAEVTAPTTVSGTASAPSLAYYQLLMRPAGSNQWQEIARGYQSIINGSLGTFDPSQLQNGIYELAVIVVNTNGVQASQMITVDVTRNLKIGQFSVSFEDLNIQASGIPIRVTRTYDTRRKSQDLDFGQGWSVDYQNVQIRKNVIMGVDWSVVTFPGQVLTCLSPAGKRKVDVTLPTGEVARFTAANEKDCGLIVPDIKIVFTALPGTTATLELVNLPRLIQAQGGMLIDVDQAGSGGTTAWNPQYYKLTTEDNYQYFLTDGIGVTSIQDPNGNVLTYSDNGVTHSNGTAATFTRDAKHHITSITDPRGQQIRYSYSATGDLISVTDRNGAISTMRYDGKHNLISYTDPNGNLAARYDYDATGRLIASYDANGKAIQLQHDLTNNQETVTDRRGNKTTYTYDNNGNVTQVVNPLNQVTTYTYDANGNQASVTNALGQTTLSSYDPKSYKQTSETDPLGKTTSWDYDDVTRTQIKNSTDANGNVTAYSYFPKGTRVDQPLGSYIHVGNDDSGNTTLLIATDQIIRYKNDAKGNKISETDPAGKVTTYAYDDNGKEISRSWIATVNVNGVPTQKTVSVTRTLDAEGRVLSETDALGATSKTEYTAVGQVSATVDPQGRRTSYAYDSTGRLSTTTYPDGKTTTASYDASGNKISDTDRQGRATKYEYDALNRITRTTAPDGSSTATTYDDAGRVASTTDAQANTTTNGYDAAGRLISLTDAKGKQSSYQYDNIGNRTQVTDATGKVTQFKYDALNRLVLTTYPDNSTSSTVWNTNGTKLSETDQAGNSTAYSYDPVGRLNQVTQTTAATAQNTVYAYDTNGNKTSQTDAQGHTTTWGYDATNRLSSRTLPAGQTESFSYDVAGNLIQKTDFTGQVTSYINDELGRVTQIRRPDGSSITTAYTASGQISSSTISGGNAANGAQNGQTTYTYDANDRVTKQVKPDGSFLSYAYDANGNITQRSNAAGTISYGYDKNQNLTTITDNAGKATSYTYDDVGRLASTTGADGITTSYSYDPNGRLLQLLHTKGSSVVVGSRYTLAANGQRSKVEEFDNLSTVSANIASSPVRTTSYQYDGVNRLTQELVKDRSNTTVRTTDYQYDKVGNRSQKTEATAGGTTTTSYVYDANDRLTQETKTTGATSTATVYTWDDKGNLSTKTTGGQVTVYNWNADNRLVEVKQGTSQATAITVAKYSYDANGNRVQKIEPGLSGSPDKVTNYLVDETFAYAQTVQESITQGTTTQSTSYVWGNGLIQQSRAGTLSYYHADALGSTKVLTDASGNITDAYQYDAFGVVVNKTGSTANSYRYTGEYFDDAVGLQFNRARWYDGSVGRFVSMDRVYGNENRPVTQNKYLYANADSVNYRDPSGNMSLAETSAVEDIQGILTAIGRIDTMLGYYGKVQSAIDLVVGLRQLLTMFEGDLTSSIPRSFPPRVDFTDAGTKFLAGGVKAFTIGSPDWLARYVLEYGKGKRLTDYVLYMPVLLPQGPSLVNTGRKINGKSVKIGLGAPGGKMGSLGGVGVVMGTERMLFRMDIGATPSGHTHGAGNEILPFNEPPFSFHVYNWGGGPR